MMKYVLVTDIPAPWREKVYEIVFKKYGADFHVVYLAHNEERRLWKFPIGSHSKTFLKQWRIRNGQKERWINFGIIPFLLKNRPQIVICFSLQPTIFLTFIVAKIIRCRICILSDTWLERDKDILWIQKAARKIAYQYFGEAFIGASKKTIEMFKFYNKWASDDAFFISWLCADNEYFEKLLKGKSYERKYDIMFSGRIVDIKNPLFFAEVAAKIKNNIGKCNALIIGNGDEKLKQKMFRTLNEYSVEYDYPGFIEHKKLPEYYSKAKVFLFPTDGDCWGVVLNEAFISKTPAITTNCTAAAGELVINGKNGYILPLNVDQWVEKICEVLLNKEKFNSLSKAAYEKAKNFNFKNAAQGIIDSIEYLSKNNT